MELPILLLAVVALVILVLAALALRFACSRAGESHDAIEYYRGWGGYRYPVGLQDRQGRSGCARSITRGGRVSVLEYDVRGREVSGAGNAF